MRAADERAGRNRQLAGNARGRRRGLEIGILPKDPLLQLAQRGTRLEPKLFVEPAPVVAVAVQRLRLAARSVQGQHREALQPLT